MVKRIAAGLLAACITAVSAGCGAADVLDSVGTELQAGGREYGQTASYSEGESAQTAFFTYAVNSAEMTSEMGDYTPADEGHAFLRVNVTVTNTFEDDAKIPMFGSDFELTWEGLGDATVYPESAFAEGQLPDEYELFKGESRTGDLIFVVPGDARGFSLKYLEIWEDDFEGNSYYVPFRVD